MVRALRLYRSGWGFESLWAYMHVTGVVIRGDGYGRTLGYPTANIELMEPLSGVFSGVVVFENTTYPAAIFATEKRPILEAHLLDFDGDLYGKQLSVSIGEKIRDARDFDTEEELKDAIAGDVQKVRDLDTMR